MDIYRGGMIKKIENLVWPILIAKGSKIHILDSIENIIYII